MCFVLSSDKSGSLVFIEDETNRFRNSVLNTGAMIDAGESEEHPFEDDKQPDQMIVYGAASSYNGLYDCVLFCSFQIFDVNYRTLVDESCSVMIRPLLDENDEMVLEDLVKCFKSPISTF